MKRLQVDIRVIRAVLELLVPGNSEPEIHQKTVRKEQIITYMQRKPSFCGSMPETAGVRSRRKSSLSIDPGLVNANNSSSPQQSPNRRSSGNGLIFVPLAARTYLIAPL